MHKYFYTFLFLLFSVYSHGQPRSIDQLRSNLNKTPNNDTSKLKAYEEIIKYYLSKDVDSVEHYLKLGYKFTDELKFERGKATLLVSEAKLFEINGELPKAKSTLLKALELFYHVNYTKGIAVSYNALGIVEAKQAKYKQATSYFLRALNINEKIKDTIGVLQSYTSLGAVNSQLEEYDKSYKYLYKALSFVKDSNTYGYCNIINNIATLYAKQEDYKNALSYFVKSYNVAEKLENPPLLTTLNTNIANCYANLNQKEKALLYYNKALQISNTYNMPEEQARLIYNIALLYEFSNPSLCIKKIQEAIDIATKINHRYLLLEIYESLYVIKKANSDFQGACTALEKFHRLNDSLLSTENKSQIELLQSNFELEKSNLAIKELELNSQKQNLQTTIAILIIIAILSILIVVALASYKRKKLNNALRHSLQVRDKLLSIIAHDLKSPINNVLSLMLELERDELSEKEKQVLLELLKKQTKLSLITLDNILTWGQAQIREVKTNPEHFEVYDIVRNNIDLFDVNLTQKNIKVNVDFDKSIQAYTDKDQFDFVIRNLLSNAIKFSKHYTEIHIKLSVLDDKLLRICIADEGLGMNADTLQSLFGVNPKINYGTDKEKGSGLGLILCKEFVEANHGTIWAESILNEGTVMCFTCKTA